MMKTVLHGAAWIDARRNLAAMLLLGLSCSNAHSTAADVDIDDRLRAIVDEVPIKDVPGIVLLVDRPGGVLLHLRGVANRKTGLSLDASQIVRAGSIGKTYVAATAIMAAEEGRVDLDSKIDAYLSPDVMAKLRTQQAPTIRQLLNHTSGIPDFVTARFYLTWEKTSPPTTEQVFRAIKNRKVTNNPGEKFHYSNTNYYVAALILEKVYEKPLETLLAEKIFQPQNLERTYYNQHRPPGDEIHGYGSEMRKWKDTYDWRENHGPDGGIKATPADLSRWLRTLFATDGDLFAVGSAMVQSAVVDGERRRQGLGVEILMGRDGTKVYGHTGGLWGYLSAAFYVPESDTVLILYMNRSDLKIFQKTLSQVLREIVSTDSI